MRTALTLCVALLAGTAGTSLAQTPCRLAELPLDPIHDSTQARVAVDRDTIAVGLPYAQTETGPTGRVLVFERRGPTWRQVADLIGLFTAPGARFGAALALEDDTLIVGSPGQNEAHRFLRTDGTWTYGGFVGLPLFPETGAAVALAGGRVLVGAPNVSVAGQPEAGAAYLFEPAGSGTWTQAIFMAPAPEANGHFGASVAISDGTVLIGAPGYASPNFPIVDGRAFFFENDGTGWQVRGEFAPQFLVEQHGVLLNNNQFGASVAIDGGLALVGAPQREVVHSGTLPGGPGRVYAYERGLDDWQASGWFEAGAPAYDAGFGTGIALARDRAVVTAPGHVEQGCFGTASRFERDGGGWSEEGPLAEAGAVPAGVTGAVAGTQGRALVLERECVLFGGAVVPVLYGLDLCGAPDELSLAGGGVQVLELDAPKARAGDLYLVLGSASGTWPGGQLAGGWLAPLVPDAYTTVTLSHPGGPLVGAFGTLDAAGDGQASFVLPAGSPPVWLDLDLHHAFAALDAVTGSVTWISGPAPLALTL